MPFGLCNAAATFQLLMQTALIGLFLKHCIIYLDDRDSQEHNANLKLVLDRLRDAGLTLNPKKCRFLQRSVTFLGYTVSSNGIAVTDDRVQQKQAKRNFKWGKEHSEVFKELKRMLCSAPILALPNFESSAPSFILDTNASDVAVGGVLSQKDIKGREHVIAYASTRLSKKCDRKGRRNSNTKKEKGIVMRMHYPTDRLQQKTGDVMVHTVFLSDPTRHHWRKMQGTDPDTALIYEKFLASSHKPASEEITSASKAARRIWREWSKLSLEDKILWYQEGVHSPKCLVVPGSLVQTVLQELHEQLGHVGEKKMLDASSKRYWWPSPTLDVRDFCRTCTTCSGFKNSQPTAIAPLQPMPTGFPGERVGIDIMSPLPPTKRGNRYILVMVDYFTKAAEAEPMKSQDAETVASVFFNRWVCQHGVPESVHSDQGPNFESRLCIELCKICQISKTRTTPAHPQGNGQVERTNRTLIGLLKAFTRDAQPDDWDLSLGRVLLAYRAMVHTSTGVSPFKMPTGREMRVPSNIFVPNTDGSADHVPEYILRLKESIRRTFNSARKHLRLSYTRQKKYYDRHCWTNVYREGDLVQIYRPVPPPGTHRKFHHPWSRDPFRVVKALSPTNYLVRNAQLRTRPVIVNHNKMRPYKGPPPVGYEDEVYVLTEDRRPPVRNLNGSS
ncbi:Transposon Ty3-I Gag-Pol polyprotein [Echinococcus granulosus]|uniref:Transposon Ty3-I Gag-Pol polyprotein n=1 Tax=Echinococcus granulosus TaxID=6210 RepID=W6UQA2_ECHGR|nr:Transposon Ty3-I Gag-Pol polyprotein [Echinococcus granulosus]EUB63870.1 Transposon Ty3-I Gag-Pol polyprotein [Echinococcus granulosus]